MATRGRFPASRKEQWMSGQREVTVVHGMQCLVTRQVSCRLLGNETLKKRADYQYLGLGRKRYSASLDQRCS